MRVTPEVMAASKADPEAWVDLPPAVMPTPVYSIRFEVPRYLYEGTTIKYTSITDCTWKDE